ncbi:Lacal_2735 family protein [Aquimarina sp. W85]|uniref:Lacal_2735 family protein n=1 Tax=Aquimarina rhodophyticola TaxID=3342246 RepID=UPI003672818C
MITWLKNRNRLQRLRNKYCRLMKNSFVIALKDKHKSDQINTEACALLKEIRRLESFENLTTQQH